MKGKVREPRGARHTVRVTAREAEDLERQAAAGGLAVSELLRRRALGRQVVGIVPEVNRAIYAELGKVGVNLNQIAHQLNSQPEAEGGVSGNLPVQIGELSKLLSAIRLEVIGAANPPPSGGGE